MESLKQLFDLKKRHFLRRKQNIEQITHKIITKTGRLN